MISRKLRKLYRFIKFNKKKGLYLKIFLLSGLYRLLILTVPMKYLKKIMGTRNQESAPQETVEAYRYAGLVSKAVNRVCDQTPWESKCLVKALTIQHFLKKKKISSTLYLGVGKSNANMIAHAWLRVGEYYVSGGNGEGYALVAKFGFI